MLAFLKLLVDPVVFVLLAFAVAAALWPRRRLAARVIIAASLVSLYLFSTPLVASRILHWLEVDAMVTGSAAAVPPQAIVVLAANLRREAPEYGGDTVGPLTLERVRYAARLHRQTGLPILVSGGQLSEGTRPLAEVMKDALSEDFGVPVRWVERESQTTYENAAFSAAMLRGQGIESVYLVTHAWHMPRAREAFAAAGLTAAAAATVFTPVGSSVALSDFLPRAGALAASAHAIHEWVGRLWYRTAYY